MPYARVSFVVLCCAGWLSACASYRPAPISSEQSGQAIEARSLEDPALNQFLGAALAPQNDPGAGAQPAQRTTWDLARLTLAALYYQPDFELTRVRLESARAAVVTAGQIPNPTLSLGLDTSPITLSPTVDFLIETFGKRGYRVDQAQALADSARRDVVTGAWQVRAHVRAALLSLWAAQQRRELQQRRLMLQDELVQLLERRLMEGEASSVDVTRERVNRNQFNLALRDAERQIADAQTQLAASIGVPVASVEDEALSFTAFEQPVMIRSDDLPVLRRQALTGRSDVQALVDQYRGAESALQLEIANQYPNVDIGPGYTFQPGEGYQFTAAASSTLPVFNQNQGPILEAEAKRRTVAGQITSLQAQIVSSIETAQADYRATSASVATANDLNDEARTRLAQIMQQFQAGDADRPTLVLAEIELSTTEIGSFEAGFQQRQALAALEDALQHPLFEPDINFVPDELPLPATGPAQ